MSHPRPTPTAKINYNLAHVQDRLRYASTILESFDNLTLFSIPAIEALKRYKEACQSFCELCREHTTDSASINKQKQDYVNLIWEYEATENPTLLPCKTLAEVEEINMHSPPDIPDPVLGYVYTRNILKDPMKLKQFSAIGRVTLRIYQHACIEIVSICRQPNNLHRAAAKRNFFHIIIEFGYHYHRSDAFKPAKSELVRCWARRIKNLRKLYLRIKYAPVLEGTCSKLSTEDIVCYSNTRRITCCAGVSNRLRKKTLFFWSATPLTIRSTQATLHSLTHARSLVYILTTSWT